MLGRRFGRQLELGRRDAAVLSAGAGTDVLVDRSQVSVALLDVEPMGEEYVHGMCHAIEDPTFDATVAIQRLYGSAPLAIRVAHLLAADYPDGHFLGWTPGQAAPLAPNDVAWRLDAGGESWASGRGLDG